MARFMKKARGIQPESHGSSSGSAQESTTAPVIAQVHINPQSQAYLDVQNLIVSDPALRTSILEIDPNNRENVRRAYLIKGPNQPILKEFPQTLFSGVMRRFNPKWYKEYASWLEYSEYKDAVFCLYCYLFKVDHGDQGGGDAFVGEGFNNWKMKKRLNIHVGDCNSIHSQCLKAGQDLMNQKQHIDVTLSNLSEQSKNDYRVRLNASVGCIRFLLRQGLAFRGHDETHDSRNQGNFLELLKFLANNNDDISKVVLQNAPENNKLVAPSIQKEITHACAYLTTKAIIADIGDELFSLLVDEARDSSNKEQMGVVLRYVNIHGCIIECFIGIVHVADTSARSLKQAIESLFATHGLSISRLRGQGYDGASNMRGEFNGLKSLILAENPSAFYVHCFAHQLQLTLVAVATNHDKLNSFFEYLSMLTNTVGVSSKRLDILREKQREKTIEGITSGEIMTGRGLNQEATLKRPGDTRWSSHYGTVMSLISLFSSIVGVLETLEKDSDKKKRFQASNLLDVILQFEFAFLAHLMHNVLGITNDLSQALQRKDQDLLNAMRLVSVAKQRLQDMREEGWETLLTETCDFCKEHQIVIPNMEDIYVTRGRSRRNAEENTNLHYFKVELLYTVIDAQLQELNSRFDNVNTKLLSCMRCLDPCNSFSAFDVKGLIEFAKFYPSEFDSYDCMVLGNQLQNYIIDVRGDPDFANVIGICGLAQKFVEKRRHIDYPLVYLLMKLALILPVATASVERVFSAMNIVKSLLRNRMGDAWTNDCLVTYIEKEVFETVNTGDIMQLFQDMKSRRMMF